MVKMQVAHNDTLHVVDVVSSSDYRARQLVRFVVDQTREHIRSWCSPCLII